MEKILIVNGDDFGWCKGVNEGIVKAYREGILSSTTILAGGDGFLDAVEKIEKNPGLGVGIHVCLVKCKPVLPPEKIPSLIDPGSNTFYPTLSKFLTAYLMGKIKDNDIYLEVKAQFEKVMDYGVKPTHFDAHKHSFIFPPIRKIVFKIAEEFGVKNVRFPFEKKKFAYGFSSLFFYSTDVFKNSFKRDVKKRKFCCPENFLGLVKTGKWDRKILIEMLGKIEPGYNELMTHPGIVDESLKASNTRLIKEREEELKLLTDKEIISLLNEKGVKIVSYAIFGRS